MNYKNYILVGISGIVLFALGFFYTYQGNNSSEQRSGISLDDKYLHFIFIGSSTCPVANAQVTETLIRDLKINLNNLADSTNYLFITTGISVDNDAKRGIAFLQKSGPYDELIVGSGWMNMGIDRYIWNEFPAYAVTPQVIITMTEYKAAYAEGQLARIQRSERLLHRSQTLGDIKKLHDMIVEGNIDIISNELDLHK